jgi:hypothetical protein
MPYINYLFCEDCGPPVGLELNYMGTIEAYSSDGRKTTVLDDREFIWDYLVYGCPRCRKSWRYTYLDVESRVRQYFSSLGKRQAERIEEVAENQIGQEERLNGEFFIRRSIQTSQRLKEMYSK